LLITSRVFFWTNLSSDSRLTGSGRQSVIRLLSDNQSTITLTKDSQFHAHSKHIDIRYHFICWIVNDGKIALEYCPTDDMVADILTKALPSLKAKFFATILGLSPSKHVLSISLDSLSFYSTVYIFYSHCL
jgi:hypothetical protein